MLLALLKFSFLSTHKIAANRPAYLGKLAEAAPSLKKKIFLGLLALAFVSLQLFMPLREAAKQGGLASLTTAIVVICVALAVVALVTLESLTPLKRTDSGCEQALSLVSCSPMAKAYRDEVLEKGEELLEIDLCVMKYFSERESEMEASFSLRKEWSGADADEVDERFMAKFAAMKKKSRALLYRLTAGVSIILLSVANFSYYSVLQVVVSTFLIILFVSLICITFVNGYEAQAKSSLEQAGPVWGAPNLDKSSLDALESIDELKKEGGAGMEFLAKLKAANKSLTFGDLDKAIQLDRAAKREVFCKQIHAVDGAKGA